MEESCDRLLKVKKSCNIAPGVVDLSIVEDENYIKGGILSNTKLSWVSCGPRLTNLNNNGSKRTGWTFGWGSGDKSIRVLCVEELPGSPAASPILLVGCETESGSSLCFYHSGCSRVLKAVQFNDKITSLAVVSKTNDLEENLSQLLKPWNGVVAVGTSSGKVYLVDVWWRALERCIEDYRHKLYDEQKQSKLVEVTINDLENDNSAGFDCRTSSVRHGSSTLAFWLNELTLQQGRRGAHPGLQNVLGRMPLDFFAVSTLKYFPQISTLAVGYNTSCFQLWDLSSLTLLYTSALLEAMLPVFSFSLLEPSDDPRYVCYLWSLHHSVDEDNIPFAGMYIINYHEKHQKQHSHQFFYEGFSSCSIRYQLDLGLEIADIASGRIISCQSIHRSSTKPSALWMQSESEETAGEEGTASLLSIVWEVWTPNQLSVYRKLTLFDLNQWYREYMPTSSDMEYSQFMAHFCLPDGQLLDAKVLPSTVKQFQALQPLDEHFYPVATSFDCLLLQQCQLMVCSHAGVQQEALEALTTAGPSGLLLPARLYKQCTQAGIRPLLVDIGSPSTLQSSSQRTYLLCVALEHEMTQFLRRCVADWADGSHAVTGCTLPGLLSWAWDRVQRYKKRLDGLCVPMFDYSGIALDNNDFGIFHHMICQLHRLCDLFRLVLEKYSNCILKGNFEQQYTVIKLVTAFYDSVFWCVRNKVLPEVNANEANINGCIPYFTDRIINSTISRRAELHQLFKSLRDQPSLPGLLLIDAVISQEAGAKVTDQWEREGASVTLGKYPPPSVQSLLRIYLIRGIQANVKHFIVTYFLLDLAHVLCLLGASETTKEKLLKYPTNFGLSVSQSRIVEAFWCLDHKQFQSGVDLLMDTSVNKEDIQVYQHRMVLNMLAAEREFKLALHYLTTRRRTPTEPQDIRMEMTVLLANDLIHEAFQFQRHHQLMSTELLEQFFKGCVEMNKLDVVFKLPLNGAEEEAFMTFLDKTSHPQADDLRVLYLLSRSRYVEAIDMNEKLHTALGVRRGMGLSAAPHSRNVFGARGNTGPPTKALTTRDLIVNSVSKSLPSITRDLADYCQREKHFSWKQINRPTPLSVVVHTELSNDRLPYYKTSDMQLIQAAVCKTREIWAPLLATPAALKRKLHTSVEDTPFLRNPIHSKINNSVTNIEEVRSGVRRRTDDEVSNISKRARLEFSTLEKENTQTENILDGSLEMDITCQESSAVLHTPLVARIVKKPLRETSTPQSILKGRSGPNTPLTPARDRLGSPAVGRQIRFSLPRERSSPSPTESEEEVQSEEGEYSKTTLSPRKSIHESSDLHSRLPTPSNPRVLHKMLTRSLRSSVTRLQFDEPETPPVEESQPEPSTTAAALLKQISSPPTSEEAYFSFQSSSSGVTNKSDSESKFKIPYGLEGNIELDDVIGTRQERTLTSERDPDVSVKIDVSEKEVEPKEMETNFTQTKSRLSEMSSVVSASQTNESFSFSLEYRGDKSSLPHDISNKFSQSFTKNKSLQLTLNDSDFSDDVELEESKYDQQVTLEEEKSDAKINQDSTQMFVKDPEPVQHDVEDAKEEQREEAMQNASCSSVRHSMYFTEQIEADVTKDEAHEEVIQYSTLQPVRDSMPVDQEIQVQNTIEEKISDEKPSQNYSLTTKSCEQEVEGSNLDTEGFVPSKQGSTLRSARGSTPLPQILEELVKRGRISLSVPGNKSSSESENVSEGKGISTEVDNYSSNFTSNTPQVFGDDAVRVETLVNEQEDNQDDFKPVSENSKASESEHVSNKDDPFLISFKQGFVFGNQASLSDSAVSRNVTFEIGSTKLESETLDDTSMETEEFSSSKFGSTLQRETEFEREDETPRTANVVLTQTYPEAQICSSSDEYLKATEVTQQCNILEAHSISMGEFNDNPSDEMLSGNIDTAEASGFNSDLPEDDQNQVLQFYIDTAASSCTQQLEADSTADFELKMSEGESVMEVSVYENNQVEAPEEMEIQEEPVLETLRPVKYHIEEHSATQEDHCLYQLDEHEEDVNDEDIYGDLEEEECEEEDQKDALAYKESGNEEDKGKVVICLGSSSDEESPVKVLKSSTPVRRQLTPKVTKSAKILSETLDYEEDLEEEEEEEGEEDNDDEEYEDYDEEKDLENETYSSESSSDEDSEKSEKGEGDSKIEKKNLYFSSESDSDTSHRRRSWKELGNRHGSNESLNKETDEDTVESPPYELIGQESQENCEEKLEPIVEETEDNSQKITKDTTLKSISSEEYSTEDSENRKQELIPEVNSNQMPAVKEVNLSVIDTSEGEKDIDIIKLAEENRQKHLETGSILDLKKRRSKRYSSTTDLSERNKVKLRRRSSSLHDFMSAFIKETKSAPKPSPEKETLNTDVTSPMDVSEGFQNNELCDGSPSKNIPSLKTQTSITSELEFNETSSITSSLLPEIGSVKSNLTSVCDFPITTVPKSKKKGKSIANRLSSLQDISEEISDVTEHSVCPLQDPSTSKTLRRSISTDQLAVSAQLVDHRIRRSNSVCRWSDYAKAHESEMIADTTDIRSSLVGLDNQDDCKKLVRPVESHNMKCVTKMSNLKKSSNDSHLNSEKEEMCIETSEADGQKEETNANHGQIEERQNEECSDYEDNKFIDSTLNSSRLQRAQSEPPHPSAISKRLRRSSSSTKINEYHKRFLYRSSLIGKSFEPQEFEIVDSDAESPRTTRSDINKMEEKHSQKYVSSKENESVAVEENEQHRVPISETFEPDKDSNISSDAKTDVRMKRGHSEPPAGESGFPQTRPRTRRSSFSQKLEKCHKLVLSRHSRKSRSSIFQPMQIVQSDEETSFQKTPEKANQVIELGLDRLEKNELLETPVTSKKRGRPKKNQTPIKEDSGTETKLKKISPLTHEDVQEPNKTSQDYPQPPKKRGRSKNKTEDETSHDLPTKTKFDQAKEIVSKSEVDQEILTVQDKKNKRQGGKNVKSKPVAKIQVSESHSDEEVLDNLEKVDSHVEAENLVLNKKGGPKKRKVTSSKLTKGRNYQKGLEKDDEGEHVELTSEGNSEPDEKTALKKKKVTHEDDETSTPKKTSKRKNKVAATPAKEQSDSENAESSLTESQKDETVKPAKVVKEAELYLDSPARRTRRSMSRMSDSEMLTPTKEKPTRRTRRNSIMSDVVLSTPNKYAESEISDASTEVNVLNTPTRRSTRRTSISATPITPDLVSEELLTQRRLTRHQRSQLQKSFDHSIVESPRLERLEEVPEESVENEGTSHIPERSARKTKATASKSAKSKASKK